ncbi:MAG: hypothetical protein ACREPK_04215 [Rhodanobacteraceae bacterium]
MKTIQIEDDVYAYIASHTTEIGEPATSILRRLLNIAIRTAPNVKPPSVNQPHELATLLSEPMFTRSTTAVSRMLRIFQEAHKQRPGEFYKVLKISGRNRIYFAKSEREILDSGESTQPREIDGTGYWVMTNSPTQMKRQMVRDVLKTLGFSSAACEAAASMIQ